MPPSIFMDSVASRQGMFPGGKIGVSPNLNFAGLPGMNGPQGALLQMVMEPMMTDLLGPGFMPAQFRPTHNLYDHYRRRMEFQSLQNTVSNAALTDQETYASMIRGMAVTSGVSWTDERERAARMMAKDMTRISPMLAQMMPDTFDRMHGARGSAQVMANGLFAGGRYRLDPVTGMLGQSADSTATMNRDLYERLYGPGADLTVMKGLGAGRAGLMFDEMSRRGLMPRAFSRDETMQGIAREELGGRGLRGADLDKELGKTMDDLGKMASPVLEEKIRRFESGRVADRIKSMAGAVAAMRDVFGEMGRPDAPMTELIEGLQVITQGGLATMTPGRVESIVRDVSNLARRTGMGMDNMTMLMAAGANRADAMGLDRTFGVTASMQAAAFGASYGVVGGTPAWGRGDKERMIAVDQQLRLNAAASPVANQLAAMTRLGQDVGFKAGSEGESLFKAVQAGETTYTFNGQTKSVHVRPGDWREMMGRSGIDIGLATAYRGDTAYNQKFIDEAGLQDVTRRVQADADIAPRLGAAFRRAGAQVGITDQAMLAKLGTAASAGLLGDIKPEDMQNPEAVASYLADKLSIDKGDAAKMNQLKLVATRGWSNIEQMIKINPRLRGYKTADQLVMAHRRSVTAGSTREMDAVAQESRLQSALAGLGQGSPLERLMDAFSGATPGKSFKDIAAETLGWVPEGEVGKRLETTVQAMQAEIAAFRDSPDAAVRKAALAKVRAMGPELRRQAEEAGLATGAMASPGEAGRIWQGARDRRGAFVGESDSLVEKLLHDDRNMSAMGPGGLELVQRVQGRNRELRGIAGREAGGDMGVLMASDEQRSKAREAKSKVDALSVRSRALEGQLKEAEARGDTGTANTIRRELEGVNKELSGAMEELNTVGREAGTTGEALAQAGPVDPRARARADELRKGQMGDLTDIQGRLKAGKRHPVSPEEQQKIDAERSKRRTSDSSVVDSLLKTMGVEVSAADRAAITKDIMGGDRGTELREAMPALQRLREIARSKGMDTPEKFQAYLRDGPGAGASAEERELHKKVSAGRGAGGGLTGIDSSHSRRESITEKLHQFAPHQRDPVTGVPTSASGGTGKMEITGTLKIEADGSGKLAAQSRGGTR